MSFVHPFFHHSLVQLLFCCHRQMRLHRLPALSLNDHLSLSLSLLINAPSSPSFPSFPSFPLPFAHLCLLCFFAPSAVGPVLRFLSFSVLALVHFSLFSTCGNFHGQFPSFHIIHPLILCLPFAILCIFRIFPPPKVSCKNFFWFTHPIQVNLCTC